MSRRVVSFILGLLVGLHRLFAEEGVFGEFLDLFGRDFRFFHSYHGVGIDEIRFRQERRFTLFIYRYRGGGSVVGIYVGYFYRFLCPPGVVHYQL